jgi:hypothetical protein
MGNDSQSKIKYSLDHILCGWVFRNCQVHGYRGVMVNLMSLRLQAHVVEKAVLEVHEEPGEKGQEERQRDGKVHLLGEERDDESDEDQDEVDETKHGDRIEPDAVLGRDRAEEVIHRVRHRGRHD